MFDLLENAQHYETESGSVNSEAMRLDNVERRAQAENLETEILTLAGQMNAVQYRFIKLLGDFDNTGGWQGDGIKSFAHWLNWKVGLNMMMAREKIRVARALADLPLIDKEFSEGKVSYSKVRAMTRVATPENEKFLLQIAEYGTTHHVELLVRKYRLCKQLEEPKENENWKRYKDLGWYQDETGMIVINARLPPEEGAVVIKTLELIQAENRRKNDAVKSENQPGYQESRPAELNDNCGVKQGQIFEEDNAQTTKQVNVDSNNVSAETFSRGMSQEDFLAERASALTQLAESYLDSSHHNRNSGNNSNGNNGNNNSNPKETSNSLGEKYQIFLHINANATDLDHKVNQADLCSIENKRFLTTDVARRLACDASLTTVLEDDKGNVLNIGRRSRIVPRAMSHAVRIRDGGCTFPSCNQTHYTDSHHIKHWADGGNTSLENLTTLCRFHHGLLHKGEYRLHRDESGNIVFTNSRNEVITRSFYPQFEDQFKDGPDTGDCLDNDIDRNTARSKWCGESMDIQHALLCMVQLE